jgi:hypothetical protein
VPLSVGIKKSMRDAGRFIDLTADKGTRSGLGPSHIKE